MQRIRYILARWWCNPSIRFPVLVFAAARLATLLIGVVAVQLSSVYDLPLFKDTALGCCGPGALRLGLIYNPYASDTIFVESLEARAPLGFISTLIEPWHRWDTGWYLKIAAFGYDAHDGSIIFGPLYPALMAVIGKVLGDALLGGLLVSSVACLAFLLMLYRLICIETGSDRVARSTLLCLIAFPTAFYLMAGYTESLFLVGTVGAILAARTNRWWLVVPLAACASLTRMQGWILCLPVGWLAFVQAPRFWQAAGIGWRDRLRQAIPRLAATGAGPLASAGFMLYTMLAGLGSIGDAYSKAPWNLLIRPPWVVVIDVVRKVVEGHAAPTEIAGLLALIFLVVLAVASLKVLPVYLHLYIWPTLIFILLRYYPLYLLNGTMRYVLDFFPLFITLGVFLNRHRRWRMLWIGMGNSLQMMMIFLFVLWLWVA